MPGLGISVSVQNHILVVVTRLHDTLCSPEGETPVERKTIAKTVRGDVGEIPLNAASVFEAEHHLGCVFEMRVLR